jgi:cobalt/nickel transport system permease protein
MHIPDSAISPATSLAACAAMAPVWAVAGRRVRTELAASRTPLLAIGAAFCFTIMMFNIPVPGGTTVHPVGGALMAVLLGPWAAVIGVSVALAVQALFFGDGGILTLGANCFTMAFALPFVSYLVYRAVASGSSPSSSRRAIAAGIGSYAGLNTAALLVAVILGIQPALHHDAAGHALYFPFGLSVTLPAILVAHLLVAGPVEAIVTTLVVRYLQAAGISLYAVGGAAEGRRRRELLWVGLGAIVALTPLGLLTSGDAWGEWGTAEIAKRAGYAPAKLQAAEGGWHGFNLLPDYLSDRGPVFYIIAAVVGVALIAVATLALGRLLARRDASDSGGDEGGSASGEGPQVRPGEVPAWMRAADPAPVEDENVRRRAIRDGFVARTLTRLAEVAREAAAGERWARRNGLLQRIDPRVKVVGILGLVLVATLSRSMAAVGLLAALVVCLATTSGVPLSLIARRVWLAVSLFAGAVCLPAAFSFVTPGPALIVLHRAPYVAVTVPGLLSAALLATRIGLAVSLLALLTLTTRWNLLLRSLRVLFVPRLFLIVLEMTFRYLSVLAQVASETFTARRSRTVGSSTTRADHRFLGGAVGALFGRSLALSGEVHGAMLSRGWTGEARTLAPVQASATDFLWLAGIAVVGALALVLR